MSDNVTKKSIAAENTFSDAVTLIKGGFNLSLSGAWEATVYVQRKFSYDDTTWMDVESFTVNGERSGCEYEDDVQYRVGVKTGGYTSGTIVARISQ